MDEVVEQICELVKIKDLILREVNDESHKQEWLSKLTDKEYHEFRDIICQHVIDDLDYYFHDSDEYWFNGEFNIDDKCYTLLIEISEVIEEFYIIYKVEYESEQLIKRVRNGT